MELELPLGRYLQASLEKYRHRIEHEPRPARVVIPIHHYHVGVSRIRVVERHRVRLGYEVVVLGGDEQGRDEAVRNVRDGTHVPDVEVGLPPHATPEGAYRHGRDKAWHVDALIPGLVDHFLAEAGQIREGRVEDHARDARIAIAVHQGGDFERCREDRRRRRNGVGAREELHEPATTGHGGIREKRARARGGDEGKKVRVASISFLRTCAHGTSPERDRRHDVRRPQVRHDAKEVLPLEVPQRDVFAIALPAPREVEREHRHPEGQ